MKQLSAYLKFWSIFLAWWLAWAFIFTWERIQQAWPLLPTLKAATLLFGLLITVCIAVFFTIKYYRPVKRKWLQVFIQALAMSALWYWAHNLFTNYFFTGDEMINTWMQNSMQLRMLFAFLNILCFIFFIYAWYYDEDRALDEQRKSDMEKLARDAELTQLRQQLQPHFLFNTLNSIGALTLSEPEQARKMVQQLSDFLRGTLKKEDRAMVSLQDEWHHLALYLEIEKVRFGHRLKTEVVMSEESKQCSLPVLLLQPVVENAIKFGLYDTTDAVTIRIKAEMKDHELWVEVSNPYDPQTAKPRQGTGFGLNSISRRLYLIFGRNDLLQTNTANQYFTAIIKIPQTT